MNAVAPDTPAFSLRLGRWKALAACAILEGQLAIGAGTRIATMEILRRDGGTLLTMTGAAPEAGALLVPTGMPWRFGISARLPVTGGTFGGDNVSVDAHGVRSVGPFVLPSRVNMPWEIEAGLAYQLGPGPLNPGRENSRDQDAWLRARIASDRADRARHAWEEVAATKPGRRQALRLSREREEESLRQIEDQRLEAIGIEGSP